MYPPIEPYASGFFETGDGNSIYWERCGNPGGKPAVYIHGGPGTGASRGARRYFDPRKYDAVLFDQRGCGRSRPPVSRASQLENNTTSHLLHDLESLRAHLSIDRWIVLGVSWGTTLALAYAEMVPLHVSGIVLGGVTSTSRREVEWITNDVGRLFPEQWNRFVNHIPPSLRHLPLVDAYALLLFNDDPDVRATAALEWCAWEDTHVSLMPGHQPDERFQDPEFRLRFARIVTHYWRHAAFLEDGQLLRDAVILNGIPGVLIHGLYDVSSPLETAWRLHRAWKSSRLQVVTDAGHGGRTFSEQIVSALNAF